MVELYAIPAKRSHGCATDVPGRAALAGIVAALLAAALLPGGCRKAPPPSGPHVRVLTWASNLAAGDAVAEADIAVVEVRQSVLDAHPGLVAAEDPALVVGKTLTRNVRRGEFVRRADVGEAAPTAPTTTGPDTRPYAGLPVGDPDEVEPAGLYEKYITTVRTARHEQLGDASARPDTSSPMPLTTQPLAETGMMPLAEDAAEVVVPDGAIRLYGFRHEVPGGINETFAYLVSGDVASVAEFYQTNLPRNGYKFIRPPEGQGDADRRYLTFAKGRQTVYFVNLRPADKGKVKVVLMISRLERE